MVAGEGVSQDRIEFWITMGLQATTISVLVFVWMAAWKQARAADKLARATRFQADANRSIAAATRAQNQLVRMQLEESLRPFLYLVWDTSGPSARLSLRNEGGGPAIECSWHYGLVSGESPPPQKLDHEAIASHQGVPFLFQMQKAHTEGLTVLYKSTTGTVCATEITWQGTQFHCRYIPNLTALKELELPAATDVNGSRAGIDEAHFRADLLRDS